MTEDNVWQFDLDKVRKKDSKELQKVRFAMISDHPLLVPYQRIKQNIVLPPGVFNPSEEERFLYYLSMVGLATHEIPSIDAAATRPGRDGRSIRRSVSNLVENVRVATVRPRRNGSSIPRSESNSVENVGPRVAGSQLLNTSDNGARTFTPGTAPLLDARTAVVNRTRTSSIRSNEDSSRGAQNSASNQRIANTNSQVHANQIPSNHLQDKGKNIQTAEDVAAIEQKKKSLEEARVREERRLLEEERVEKDIPSARLRAEKKREVDFWKKEAKKLKRKLKENTRIKKDEKRKQLKRKHVTSSSSDQCDSSDQDQKKKKSRKNSEPKTRKHTRSSSDETSSSDPENDEGEDGKSGGQGGQKKMFINLDKDREPEFEHVFLVQDRIHTIADKIWPGWVHWRKEKKRWRTIRKFHRQLRSAWANGNSIETTWIHNHLRDYLKNRRYRKKKSVKVCYSVVDGKYLYPDGCSVSRATFADIVRELQADPTTQPKLHQRAHSGDMGSKACKGRKITNVWGRAGWPGFLGCYQNRYKRDPSKEDKAFGREWTWMELTRKLACDAKGREWVPLAKSKSLTEKIVLWKKAGHIVDIVDESTEETAEQREARRKDVQAYLGNKAEGDRFLEHFPNANSAQASFILDEDISDEVQVADENFVGMTSESEGPADLLMYKNLVNDMTSSSSGTHSYSSDADSMELVESIDKGGEKDFEADDYPTSHADTTSNLETSDLHSGLGENLTGALGGDASQNQSDEGSQGDDERDEDTYLDLRNLEAVQPRKSPPRTRGANRHAGYQAGAKKKSKHS